MFLWWRWGRVERPVQNRLTSRAYERIRFVNVAFQARTGNDPGTPSPYLSRCFGAQQRSTPTLLRPSLAHRGEAQVNGYLIT